MTDFKIDVAEIADMVRHYLQMQANGYLGQGYGNTLKDLLQKPMNSTALADREIRKLQRDVPILTQLPKGSITLFAEDIDKETKRIILDIAGNQITIDSLGNVT